MGDSWRAAGQGLPLQGEDEDGGRAMAGESVEVYPDVTGSFRSSALLGSPKKIAQSGLPPKELLQLPKRDLIQVSVKDPSLTKALPA